MKAICRYWRVSSFVAVFVSAASLAQAQQPEVTNRPSTSQAGETALSPKYSECMDRAGGITSEMLNCIEEEMRLQDTKLNENYKALQSNLPPARQQPLLEAQRAWIRYRDLNCAYYADPYGGTLARVSGALCMLTMTAERALELERLLADN